MHYRFHFYCWIFFWHLWFKLKFTIMRFKRPICFVLLQHAIRIVIKNINII